MGRPENRHQVCFVSAQHITLIFCCCNIICVSCLMHQLFVIVVLHSVCEFWGRPVKRVCFFWVSCVCLDVDFKYQQCFSEITNYTFNTMLNI